MTQLHASDTIQPSSLCAGWWAVMSDTEIQAIVLCGIAAACLLGGLAWAAALRSQAASWQAAIEGHPIQALNAGLLIWLFGVQGMAAAAELLMPWFPVRAVVLATPFAGVTIWAVARRGHRQRGDRDSVV